ncbi:MAG: ribosome maturation factor RimM [Hyphomonadaceae bacterium]|nr:ribosome maturation factor RimM [Hyphomonadaceae bacterium]
MLSKQTAKPAAKAAVAKATAPAQRAPKKEAPKTVKAKAAPAKAAKPSPKPSPTKSAKPAKAPPAKAPPIKAAKPAAPPASKAKAPALKPEPKAKAPPSKKVESKPAAPAKKAEAKPAPTAKPATPPKVKVEHKANGADAKTAATAAPKPAATAKPVPAPKPPKPAKPAKEPKPPKLAPVEAAFAKPRPAKPLAVAAGRAQPLARTLATPVVRSAPRPLATPKPTATPEPELVGELKPVPAYKGKSGANKGMVLVGAIAGAFGVKGEVRLRAFTEKKEGVISYGPLYGEDQKLLLRPKNWRELRDGVAVTAPEVKSREDAEKMRGQKLYVPRANLPSPAEDEFYIVDLLGCRAEALDGNVLGEICAVWNFGAGDIIEYRPPNGGPNVRVTFTKDTAPLVDLAGKRVVLDPPAPEAIEK